jgi:hypothetical protein
MYYQCYFGLQSEDGTINDTGFESLRSGAWATEGDSGLGKRDLGSSRSALLTWWSWVTEYSSRVLTFHSDKMAAMAGIAEHYQSRTGDTSVLGLWKRSLWFDLGWHVDMRHPHPPGDENPQPRLPGIPTWSWLSIHPGKYTTAPLNLEYHEMEGLKSRIKLIHCSVQWQDEPYTSPLVSSELIVEAPVQTTRLPQPRGKNPLRLEFEAEWNEFLRLTLFLDGLLEGAEREGILLLLLFEDSIYEYALALKLQGDGAYARVGFGHIDRPRGAEGFFSGCESKRATLV